MKLLAKSPAGLRAAPLALAVASIAVSWLTLVLGLSLAVLRQRLSDIDNLVEAPFVVSTHVALVSAGIDQFAFARCHTGNLQLSLFNV